MSKRKILGFENLNKELGLFNNQNNYNLAEKSILTRPYSFELWAVAYIVDNVVSKLNFKEIAFLMMVSDLKFFEEHFLPKRTGWSIGTCNEMLNKLRKDGYFTIEKPSANSAIYGNSIYKTTYKYHPTHKYRSLLKKIEDALKQLHEKTDEAKKRGLVPPSKSSKGNQFTP